MIKNHKIKVWPKYYSNYRDGSLTVAVRKNDRDYQDGDVILMEEFEPLVSQKGVEHPDGNYTGAYLWMCINRVFDDVPGLKDGYVLLSLRPHVQR